MLATVVPLCWEPQSCLCYVYFKGHFIIRFYSSNHRRVYSGTSSNSCLVSSFITGKSVTTLVYFPPSVPYIYVNHYPHRFLPPYLQKAGISALVFLLFSLYTLGVAWGVEVFLIVASYLMVHSAFASLDNCSQSMRVVSVCPRFVYANDVWIYYSCSLIHY